MPELLVVDLGRLGYAESLEVQRAVARARIAGPSTSSGQGLTEDVLLLVEHPPVITLGRSTKATSLPLSVEALQARGVEVHEVERGGDVTFHGPGQLVGYPIIDLKRHKKDLHWYLRQIEQGLIDALGTFDVPGSRVEKYTGVWVADRKIASIGVHARDWVTWHGFALNVTTALSYFDLIVPCGIAGVEMTSLGREMGRDVTLAETGEAVANALAAVFDLAPIRTELAALDAALDAAPAAV